jgi:hypothetical protein
VVEAATAIAAANEALAAVRSEWGLRKVEVLARYETILRDLQRSKVDGEEFIKLRHKIEELKPLRERQTLLERDLAEHESKRRNLLAEWEDLKSKEFRELQKASKTVTRRLTPRVRVSVTYEGNREPLMALLRDQVGGRLSEALQALEQRPELSVGDLAAAIREGRDGLVRRFSLPQTQAERIAQAPFEVAMLVEELELPSTTVIELNVAAEEQAEIWQKLDRLSTGQKATAVLLLLLLESDAPLIVDQPEDDLDNRFITEGVVPKMREEKRRRQFIFATHNANVPVLGDAELILGLTASGEAGGGSSRVALEHMGSIDAKPVRELVEELLEGGKMAFETRRLKYGF